MDTTAAVATLACVLSLGCNACLSQRHFEPSGADEPTRVNVHVVVWPEESLVLAHLMLGRYGVPEEVHSDRLVWLARWPWKRIVVSTGPAGTPLEQVVDYRVPPEKLEDVESFSSHLRVDAARGELSSLSDREDYNRLALNLADDVVCGRMTPAQARRFFARTVRLAVTGKSSPYTKRLFFAPLPPESESSRMDRF
jgi:hypothetical protein